MFRCVLYDEILIVLLFRCLLNEEVLIAFLFRYVLLFGSVYSISADNQCYV